VVGVLLSHGAMEFRVFCAVTFIKIDLHKGFFYQCQNTSQKHPCSSVPLVRKAAWAGEGISGSIAKEKVGVTFFKARWKKAAQRDLFHMARKEEVDY